VTIVEKEECCLRTNSNLNPKRDIRIYRPASVTIAERLKTPPRQITRFDTISSIFSDNPHVSHSKRHNQSHSYLRSSRLRQLHRASDDYTSPSVLESGDILGHPAWSHTVRSHYIRKHPESPAHHTTPTLVTQLTWKATRLRPYTSVASHTNHDTHTN
jgi:hypothetical protein